MIKTIEDIRSFWDKNPLLTGEIEEPIGSRAWFEQFDLIKTGDVFRGDLSRWVPNRLDEKRVLDVGCGPGYWNRIFGKMKVEYNGIDISGKSVELATKSQQIFNLHGKLQVGNAESLPFEDKYFDYVVSEGVIHHTPNTQQCINEIYRVLKKGGLASVSLYYKNMFFRSPLLFRTLLFIIKTLRIGLRGRGREKMALASSPEEFVRMYDGADNPIGKAYTKKELSRMFEQFSKIKYSRYYIPSRAIRFKIPQFIANVLSSSFGLMILVQAEK